VAAEIGDLLFLVARLADLCGVDLDEAQRMVLTKFKRRLAESGPRR
jgi:NTP pyrophosphatase (non-canonical NTP hydrolase)